MIDALTQRYLIGTFQGTDRVAARILTVMADHGCSFDHEEMLSRVNAVMKARQPSPPKP
jgi:hypothetical protein